MDIFNTGSKWTYRLSNGEEVGGFETRDAAQDAGLKAERKAKRGKASEPAKGGENRQKVQ